MIITALIFGLLGSFHCIGMCGPIAFMLPLDRQSLSKKILQLASYHFGRLLTYSLIGLLFGVLGKGFYLLGFQQQISIILGALMIVSIIFPKVFKSFSFSNTINKYISKVKSLLGTELKKRNKTTFFTIGFLNGFLPCGLVYMAVLGALTTQNALQGSVYMFVFGLGTVPLMTAVIFLGNFTKQKTRTLIRKAIPVVVVCFGVLFILRGLGLGIPFISPKPVIDLVTNTAICN